MRNVVFYLLTYLRLSQLPRPEGQGLKGGSPTSLVDQNKWLLASAGNHYVASRYKTDAEMLPQSRIERQESFIRSCGSRQVTGYA